MVQGKDVCYYHSLEVLANAIKQSNEITCIRIWKEEPKVSLFTDDVIVRVKIPKKPTKKKKVIVTKRCKMIQPLWKRVQKCFKSLLKC